MKKRPLKPQTVNVSLDLCRMCGKPDKDHSFLSGHLFVNPIIGK